MSTRWFVTRDLNGAVTHLTRIVDTGQELHGAFYRGGAWHEDGTVVRALFDAMPGEDEIDESEADAIIGELEDEGAADDESEDPDLSADALRRAGFLSFFEFADIRLPADLGWRGLIEQDGWGIRYVLNPQPGGGHRLDFLAMNAGSDPIHGGVNDDGSVEIFEGPLQSFSVAPGDEAEAAEHRFDEHNEHVEAELARKRLI